jgi:hypothetical protein
MTRTRQTVYIEVRVEEITIVEVSRETSVETALEEVVSKEVDLTKSATYTESQGASQQSTPLTNKSKRIINSVNILLVPIRNLQLYITTAS